MLRMLPFSGVFFQFCPHRKRWRFLMTAMKPMNSWVNNPANAPKSVSAVKAHLVEQLMEKIQGEKEMVQKVSSESFEESRGYRGTEVGSPSASKKLQVQFLAQSLKENAWSRGVEVEKLRQFRNSVKSESSCVLGALVQMVNQQDQSVAWYFLVEDGGGNRLQTEDGREVIVICVRAPLAKKMITKEVGDRVAHFASGTIRSYKITAIE